MKCLAKLALKILGWKYEPTPAPVPKCIILGVPHTSGWDFIISYLFYHAVGGKAYVMVKKEFFNGPLGPIVKAMGGIPVDRGRGVGAVKQVIDKINSSETLHLAIAPEGTRKFTENWKTGFHTIARACDIPVYMGYYDWGIKKIGVGPEIKLTDDAKADLKRIRQHYKDQGIKGKHPENFTTGKDLD